MIRVSIEFAFGSGITPSFRGYRNPAEFGVAGLAVPMNSAL